VHVYQNNHYYAGPSRNAVQSATHRVIKPVRISNASHAGETRLSNRELSIYRPTVERTANRPRVINDRPGATPDNNRTAPVRTTTTPVRHTEPARHTPVRQAPAPARAEPPSVQRPKREFNPSPGNNHVQQNVQEPSHHRQASRPAPANPTRHMPRNAGDHNVSRPHRR
jgi:hypothetical protein